MSIIESLSESTDKATDIGEEYIDASREYYKLKIFKEFTTSLSLVTKILIFGILILFIAAFILIAAAIYIGNILENLAAGYLIVAGIISLLTLVAFSLRQKIDRKIIQKFSKKIFK